jgi:hypothetical protein
VVTFWRDGRFLVAQSSPSPFTGSLPALAAERTRVSDEDAPGASGTYQIGAGRLELRYADGHIEQITFSIPLASAIQPTHPIVFLDGVPHRLLE